MYVCLSSVKCSTAVEGDRTNFLVVRAKLNTHDTSDWPISRQRLTSSPLIPEPKTTLDFSQLTPRNENPKTCATAPKNLVQRLSNAKPYSSL
jgi:hypothetical protein